MNFLKNKWVIGLLVIAIAGGGYWWYSSSKTGTTTTRYALAAVTRDTIVTTVNGTGQVSGNRQLDVKPRIGARVTKVLVKVGDKVHAGQQLVDLDRTDALKTVRDATQSVHDAEISLESTRISLQKAQQPSDMVSLMQAQDSLAKAQRDYDTLMAGPTEYQLQQAQADVDSQTKNMRMSSDGVMPQVVRDSYNAYVTSLQSIEQTLNKSIQDSDGILGVDKPVVKIGLTRMFSILDDSARYKVNSSYQLAYNAVDAASDKIDALSQDGEKVENIEAASTAASAALDATSAMLSDMGDALNATMTSSDLSQSDLDGLKSTIDSDRTTVNAKITALLAQQQSVIQAKDSYDSATINYQKAVNTLNNLKQGPTEADKATAQEKIKEAQAQVDKLKAGADPLDLRIAEISVERSMSSLNTAKNNLADANLQLSYCAVIAPFDGIVASVPIQPDEDVSAGTAVATLVTSQQLATISLNEVDAAKVQVGQKATMTFDAIDGLTMTGEVAQVSPVGTVSQGVVSYSVEVGFDSQDDRIKSGMSVTTAIVTKVQADVLTVPNAAVKTQGEQSYVETLPNASSAGSASGSSSGLITSSATPNRVTVQTGLSNDTLTEIVSGLKEGDMVITQTIKSGTTATTGASTAGASTNLLRMGGAAMGGGRGPGG